MEILYFLSLIIIGIIGAGVLWKKNKRIYFLMVICLLFQAGYGYKEKIAGKFKDFRNILYQDEILKRQDKTLRGIDELKEKEKKGLLTESDYSLYIVRYLESIDRTLKYADGKNIREWIATYYEAVEKIPNYFTYQEWKESEKLIYDSIVEEVKGGMFGTEGSIISTIEIFKKERNKLLQAKEREFNK